MPLFRSLSLGLRTLGAGLLIAATAPAWAAEAPDLRYQTPTQSLVDLVDAAPTPAVIPDPRGEWLLILDRPGLPPISELSERELRLGGLRLRPRTDGRSRDTYFTGARLLRLSDLAERPIGGLPDGARLQSFAWSPDGARVAFTHSRTDGIELWVAEVAAGKARRVTAERLSLTAGVPPQWLADGKSLVVLLVPAARGAEPAQTTVPEGPVVQENTGRAAPARTFQDLLKTPGDEALFEHYMTTQVARVTLDGQVTRLGGTGLVFDILPSPDGRYLLVQSLHRPFSYLVPAFRFPRRTEVWDLAGASLRTLADVPLQEEVTSAFDSVPAGPRGFRWREDAPATLFWVEALDGGDAGREATQRDRLFLLPSPFQGDAEILATLEMRFDGITWGSDRLALVDEGWWKSRRHRTWRLAPGAAGKSEPELLFDRSSEDRYGDPGLPLTTWDSRGRAVLRTADGGRTLFLAGDGASTEGDRPFLDAFDLATRKTRRLFRSTAPWYEEPVDLLDAAGSRLLLRRESVEEPTNYWVRDLASGALRQITRFPHPTPQLTGIGKELIRYLRADGLQLTATLYTPAGWKPADGPLPTLFWAYPQEFKSADAAGQVSTSPYRFVRLRNGSPLFWLTQGYAVVDDPAFPIVGEGEHEPNDSYVQQLVASAKAAVDEVVRRGVADRRRIAIGGHSYGAFTTANLLAHSDLFAAGIAESGAYNRTLTPFGFQSEERDLWKAKDTYMAMSPFLFADQVNEPLLLIHGQADNNPGTDPIQSERFFNALKGNGALARLVLLPYESHGYRGRESVLHVMWETGEWLDRYVKNRPEGQKP